MSEDEKTNEGSGQKQRHEETDNSNVQNRSAERAGREQDAGILLFTLEEKENKAYLKSLFNILILMKKETFLGMATKLRKSQKVSLTPDTFQTLLECPVNSGKEVPRKPEHRFNMFCSKTRRADAGDL